MFGGRCNIIAVVGAVGRTLTPRRRTPALVGTGTGVASLLRFGGCRRSIAATGGEFGSAQCTPVVSVVVVVNGLIFAEPSTQRNRGGYRRWTPAKDPRRCAMAGRAMMVLLLLLLLTQTPGGAVKLQQATEYGEFRLQLSNTFFQRRASLLRRRRRRRFARRWQWRKARRFVMIRRRR